LGIEATIFGKNKKKDYSQKIISPWLEAKFYKSKCKFF
jgi:hypothetical protein